MRPIWEAYDEHESDECCLSNYLPLIESMGYEIVISVDDNDYQGDSRLLLKDGENYGWLIFGWGSCSGCDALQACNTWHEVAQLRDELRDQITWVGRAVDTLNVFKTRDWAGDWSWNAEETRQWVDMVIAYFEPNNTASDSEGSDE